MPWHTPAADPFSQSLLRHLEAQNRWAKTCSFPTTMSWYKPLSKRDGRRSSMAVLLVNNGDAAADLSFKFSQVILCIWIHLGPEHIF
jgi:hypothetical protein